MDSDAVTLDHCKDVTVAAQGHAAAGDELLEHVGLGQHGHEENMQARAQGEDICVQVLDMFKDSHGGTSDSVR